MFSQGLLLIAAVLCTNFYLGYGKTIGDIQNVLEEDVLGGVTIEDDPYLSEDDDVRGEGAGGPSGSNDKGGSIPGPIAEEDNLLPSEDGDDEEGANGPSEESPGQEPVQEDNDNSDNDDDDDDDFGADLADNDDDDDFGQDSADDDEDTANGYEDDGITLRRKRRDAPRGWVLSTPDHPMHVTLVKLDDEHHRAKRTSFNTTAPTWPHRIPYAYEDFNPALKHQLEEVLKFLEDHLCVKFFHEPDHDPNNPDWFKEHGYSTNAYIRFKSRKVCASVYGRGADDKGGRNVSPCTQWVSMMHEVIHSLGGIHSQNYPYRERYITMHEDNIETGKTNNFRKTQPDSGEVEYENFDPTSLLMYSRGYFSNNGQFAFDYVRPEMAHLSGPATYRNIILELNKNYKCIELFCKDEDPDCGAGYMGYLKQKCACVCPEGFDPSNKCKTLINGADTSITWPDTAFSLYKAEDCPAGQDTGRVPLRVGRYMMNSKKLSTSRGGIVNFDMCSKTTGSGDLESWPIGSYCIVKAKDVPCSTPFEEGEITITTSGITKLTGSVGDVTVKGIAVTMKYCCRKEGEHSIPMKLPTDKPFRLTMNDIYCQEVEGMWTLPGYIILRGKASKKGAAPQVGINRVGLKQTSCYYQPPTYGCSQEVILDSNNPTTSVSVPSGGNGREPNKRCFFYFQAPEGSRLRLTLQKLKLHPNDRFLVKRFNLLENPHQIDLKRPPYQMITEKHQLMIEYWSYFEAKSIWSGADFKIDLLSPDNLCYDAATQGADYAGKKDVSETYEGCVPWSEATTCPDFPWDGTNGLHLLNSGNDCRNLDTTGMFQPWCYTYVNGSMCQRRYCDVCNEADPVDILSGCKNHINKSPNFCTDALGRFGCFKSCGMDTATYNKAEVKCSKPVLPAEITATGGLQESYDIGSKVTTSCGEIECTAHGWSPFDESCSAQCIDASQLCENVITNYPEFCTNEKSKPAAEKYCKKTCGKCGSASCSASTGGSYSLVAGSPSTISTGQNVEFACNDGRIHVSGDLKRACSVSGVLLGDDPVCQAAPVDINIQQIFEKSRTIPRATAYLMVGNGLDVPFDGKITRWHYYCNNDGMLTLLVYRRTSNPKNFQLIGSNEAPCMAGWPWSHDVPTGDQIAVKKGDLLGVYDKTSTVAAQPCQANKNKWAPNVTTKARKVNDLLTKKVTRFAGNYCSFVAVGARVDPN